MDIDLIDGEQCAGARGMLRMSQAALAALAGVHQNTVIDFERGNRTNNRSTALALRAALESQGASFVFESDARGVLLAGSAGKARP